MIVPRTDELILIRHAAVAERYRGVCYGASDVELDASGERASREIAARIQIRSCDRVMHSGLARTRYLAERLAERFACPLIECPALRERHFGDWELRPWDAIHAQHGDAMLGMLTHPEVFRPGGGETTFELRDRVMAWFRMLPAGRTIAVTHGGPIAVLRRSLSGSEVADWPRLIPDCGGVVRLRRHVREAV